MVRHTTTPLTLTPELRERIKAIAATHGAHNVRVFGSVARGDNTASSDLDLLVRFDDDCTLLDAVGLRMDLELELGVPVDVVSDRGIKKNLEPYIIAEARPL